MLIEIHLLQNHAPSNLNRDDTGSPKECTFGGTRRARISSQCLKRSIRRSGFFQNAFDETDLATRTRRLPELVRKRFLEAGFDEETAKVAAKKASGFGTGEGKEQPEKDGQFATAQTMFLSERDIEAVTGVLMGAAKEDNSAKKFEARKAADLQTAARQSGFRPISVDIALFGRMTTSAALRDVEATCQVAHALSTHKVEHEYDYFTAADDLRDTGAENEEDAGADMLGDIEYNSACYYKYFSLDLQGLVDNLTGANIKNHEVQAADQERARKLAQNAVLALLESACRVTPTGKQNSFAAHQLPAAVWVEVRPNRAPVSYANAFVDAVRPGQDFDKVKQTTGRSPDLVATSLYKLSTHAEALTTGFDLQSTARFVLAPEFPLDFKPQDVTRVNSLTELREQLRAVMQNGFAETK